MNLSDPRPLHRLGQQIKNQGSNLSPQTLDWLMQRVGSRWYPRHLEQAACFLRNHLGDSPFYLYGAGSHSAALLKELRGDPILKQLRGFLDGHAEPGRQLDGYSVFPSRHALDDTEPLIVLSHHEFEDSMRRDLLALGVPPERIQPIYADDRYGAAAMAVCMAQLLPTIAALPKNRRILFVSARPRRIVDEDVVNRLRQMFPGQYIHLRMDRGLVNPSGAFDVELNAHNGLSLCLHLIEQLDPDLIYVQEHYSSGNFLPLLVGLAFPDQTVIAEFYDFLGLTFDDPYVLTRESYWRADDVTLALESERWCAANLYGLVTKEDGEALDEYLADARVLKFQPTPDHAGFKYKNSGPNDPIRLVWAGTIAPSRLSSVMFGDNQLIDVFRILLEAGFHVTAFTSCSDDSALANDYGDYLELARDYPLFMKTRIPRDELISVLARDFDFGLMIGIPKPDTQQGVSHKVTVPGKLQTYIAANLPTITGAYLEVMAKVISENGLGLVVDHNCIRDLPQMIAQIDYNTLVENIRQYRRAQDPEQAVRDLAGFLSDGISST